MFQKLIARQLAKPSGLVGRTFTARWLNRANARMNQLTLAQLAISPQDSILEVGFGGGDLLEQILRAGPPALLAGLDISPDMVQLANRRLQRRVSDTKFEVRCGDIENILYATGQFNKLCSVNTIYFWRNPAAALAECRRVLQTGGQILLCFNSREDLETWPIHRHGFRLYDVAEVEALLRAAGFENIQVTSANDEEQGLYYCVQAVAV
ncbi:MAG TPA: class I SAM-dependent methyltransferase [Pyrinomonadaceae bacterium]|nr:class I SAM-dependent methyltransferase [Pyrinomonadaceae bacterium]